MLCSLIGWNHIRNIICVTLRLSWCQHSCLHVSWVKKKSVRISLTPEHDHHEMYFISALTAVNLISLLSCSRYAICGWNYSEKLLQVSVAQSWIRKKASSVAFAVCLRRFVRWHTSDAKPYLLRPLARRPRARPWPSGVRVEGRTARHWRQIQSVNRFVRSCPCAYKWGMERDISQTSTQAGDLSFRCAELIQNQQRCLTLCSSCASWDSSPSLPPVTSRTAPEEGNERCRRLGSDRFGPLSFLSSFGKSSFLKSFGSVGLEIFPSCLWVKSVS